jgi:hypothetical protein
MAGPVIIKVALHPRWVLAPVPINHRIVNWWRRKTRVNMKNIKEPESAALFGMGRKHWKQNEL